MGVFLKETERQLPLLLFPHIYPNRYGVDNLRKPDDVDTKGPDHAADSARYGLLHQKYTVKTMSMW